MEKIDVAIIGGGIIGLAVASYTARDDKNMFIFEKNRSFGQESSSRNSEVIHSGIYYPTDSLKTETCVEGNRMLYEICREYNIPHKRSGKLIVARDSSEIPELEVLFRLGEEKGLEGIRMLSKDEISGFEPNIRAIRAIYLPMTGIIDTHFLMEFFLHSAGSKGADIIYESEVIHIEKKAPEYLLTVRDGTGGSYTFSSRVVINCAGLNSDEVAAMVGIHDDDYRLSYCKGEYFRLGNRKNDLVKMPVYPVVSPDDTSLGIHVTPDLAGGVRLGPDAEYLDTREIDYSVNQDKKDMFYESVKDFLPFVEKDDLSTDTSGIRSKLQGPDEPFRDFVIKHETERGFEGFINAIGIESPGFTASPAIAKMIKTMIKTLV